MLPDENVDIAFVPYYLTPCVPKVMIITADFCTFHQTLQDS
jgi:hypothetical protein